MTTHAEPAAAHALDDHALGRLITAAGGHPGDVRQAVDDLGFAAVAFVLADEVAFRADVPIMDLMEGPIRLGLDVTDGDQTVSHVIEARHGEPVTLAAGTDPHIAMIIEYDVIDLVTDLFGPARDLRAGRRRMLARYEEAAAQRPELRILVIARSTHQAVTAVLNGIDKPADLGALAVRYYSDKWGGMHWFTPHYEHHFGPLRDKPVRVLEIGIGGYMTTTFGGGSLRMWRRFFTRGLVYGLDLFDKTIADQPRVKTLMGSQSDPEYLDRMAREYGPFDVIVDDGSHVNDHVITSFRALLPHLNPGGFYVVEDLWTAYAPGYGGQEGTSAGPGTSIGLLKEIIDALHHEEHTGPTAGDAPDELEANVVGLHLYHNLAVVQKGRNVEGGAPPWVPHTQHPSQVLDADGRPGAGA